MASAQSETTERVNQLQIAEQTMQTYLQQKQNFQTQQLEVESALKELENTTDSYKIIGNIMVKSSKDDLVKELDSKLEMLSVRIKAIEKQEEKLKEKTEELQKEILSGIENK